MAPSGEGPPLPWRGEENKSSGVENRKRFLAAAAAVAVGKEGGREGSKNGAHPFQRRFQPLLHIGKSERDFLPLVYLASTNIPDVENHLKLLQGPVQELFFATVFKIIVLYCLCGCQKEFISLRH